MSQYAPDTQMFPIWAEENAGLGAGGAYEWAFGNGSNTNINQGIVMYVPTGYRMFCVAMGCQVQGTTPTATIELVHNSTLKGAAAQVVLTTGNRIMTELATPLEIASGDLINFHTVASSGTATSSRVVAWFRMVKVDFCIEPPTT